MRPRAILVLGAAALLIAGCSSSDSDIPGEAADAASRADVRFVTGMVPHHQEAVRMVAMAEGRSLTPGFAELLRDIQTTQSAEIERMRGWLEAWGVGAQTSMGHRRAHGMGAWMPMGSRTHMPMGQGEAPRMRGLHGAGFEDMWLGMMIRHHQDAIEMAEAELAAGSFAPARALARSIKAGQTAEIELMERMIDG